MQTDPAAPRTLFAKIWDQHTILTREDGTCLLWIDRHFVHEGSFHGFGIGASEVRHALASGTLWQRPPKTLGIAVEGTLGAHIAAKDIIILAIIGRIGAAGAAGPVIECAGSAVRGLDMEGQLTVCNMSIEAGGRAGMVAPDETNFGWIEGRATTPKGERSAAAVAAMARSAGCKNIPFHDPCRADQAFVLDHAHPVVLVAGENFGCGSSREGAVYALVDSGVRCVIAPSFGDIFAGNASKNGLLTIVLPAEQVSALRAALPAELSVDLPGQTLRLPDGSARRFEVEPFRKRRLLEGLDDFGPTLQHRAAIMAFQQTDSARQPWMAPDRVAAP
jgi:3-isopropylmalate/(R)-2-methylmalate dehydratase small subunit